MDQYAVIFFTVDETRCGRRRRRENWQYFIEERIYGTENEKVLLVSVVLPGSERRKRRWKPEEKTAYLSGIDVPEEGRTVCYLYGDGADVFLGRKREPLSMEWSLFLLQWFRTTQSRKELWWQTFPEALLLVADYHVNTEEWVHLFARRTRYIGILTDDPQALEELQEEIYEEYGFMIETGSDIRKLHLPDGDRGLLLVSGANLRLIKPAALPHNCVWLYTMTEGSEAGRLCSGLHDAYYLDIYSAWKKM